MWAEDDRKRFTAFYDSTDSKDVAQKMSFPRLRILQRNHGSSADWRGGASPSKVSTANVHDGTNGFGPKTLRIVARNAAETASANAIVLQHLSVVIQSKQRILLSS